MINGRVKGVTATPGISCKFEEKLKERENLE